MKHPDDGALLRYLDMELPGVEFDDVSTHLRRCISCRQTLAEIQNTMSLVANVLSRTDISVRQRRQTWLPRMVLLAASILLAVTVCLSPLRAWVVEGVRLVWGPVEVVEEPSSQAEDAVGLFQPATGSISFAHPNAEFVLELTSRQAGGTLTVLISESELATATISGEVVDESLLVLPDRLRIANSVASTATYSVVLPATVKKILVVVANEDAVLLQPSNAQGVWEIPVQVR